jgi:hypothetical protein
VQSRLFREIVDTCGSREILVFYFCLVSCEFVALCSPSILLSSNGSFAISFRTSLISRKADLFPFSCLSFFEAKKWLILYFDLLATNVLVIFLVPFFFVIFFSSMTNKNSFKSMSPSANLSYMSFFSLGGFFCLLSSLANSF